MLGQANGSNGAATKNGNGDTATNGNGNGNGAVTNGNGENKFIAFLKKDSFIPKVPVWGLIAGGAAAYLFLQRR